MAVKFPQRGIDLDRLGKLKLVKIVVAGRE